MSGHLEAAIDKFAAQFEESRHGLIYRRSGRGEALKITAAERDDFVAAYRRNLRWLVRGGALVFRVALFAALLATFPATPSPLIVVPVCVISLGIYLLIHRRIWNAPATALEGRFPVLPALTTEQAQSAALRQLQWSQLGLALVMIPILLMHAHSSHDGWLKGWNLAGDIAAALLAVGVAIQAFRKWRFDRSGD